MEGFKKFASKSKEAPVPAPFASPDDFFNAPATTPLDGEIIPPNEPDVPLVQEKEPMVIEGDMVDETTASETLVSEADIASETRFKINNVSETICSLCGEEGHSAENCPDSHTIPSFAKAIPFEEEKPGVESFEDPIPEVDSDIQSPTIPQISDQRTPEIPRIETGP